MNNNSNIGLNIKYYRIGLGLSQEYVASTCGLKQPSYAAYESGKKTPKFDTVKEIAKALGIHPLLLYRDNFNNNRGYIYNYIFDNCKDISKDNDGNILVKFDQSYDSLYDFYIWSSQNKRTIANDYKIDTPEYIENIRKQDLMADYFMSTWPEFDYSYKIDTGKENDSMDKAQRHTRERFLESFAVFFSRIKKTLKL